MSTTPRSIAFYTPGWPEEVVPNGIVRYVTKMRAALARLDVRVRVLAYRTRDQEADPDVVPLGPWRAARLKGPRTKLLMRLRPEATRAELRCRAIAEALGSLTEEPPALLQMEETQGWAVRVRELVDVPVVVRLHGPWFLNGPAANCKQDAAYRRRLAREGAALRRADGVTAPSRDVLEQACEFYGFTPERRAVIPNPIPLLPEAELWRPDDERPPRVLFIGRFDSHKGGDVVIDAFARVEREHPDAELVFVGPDRGVDRGGATVGVQEYLRSAVPAAVADGRARWLGERPQTELPALRRSASLVVVPSRYENFANTATEALAAGCPLVVTETGGLPEIVQHERNGLLARPGDAESLAERIGTLLTDPALAARLGARARQDALERYDPAVLAQRTLDFHAGVLEASRSG